jgi:aminoglycoside 6'-N-acetyltransferase
VHLVLRELRDDDVEELRRIHSTPDVACWWGAPEEGFPWHDAPDATRLTIELDGNVAGLIEYHEELTPRYRHASIDVFIDPAVRGRGVAPDAIARLVRRLIDERGHDRFTIDPACDNAAAIRAYEKVGFKRVGVLRCYERVPDSTRRRDGLLMDLLADELPSVPPARSRCGA